ncbi:hypothetical protein EJ07DRAFT_109299 [Lizonia empirigonia]|nr:hypothetical protein EJ07DRAFT_109299 [Lizonia empirigonia]
MLFQDLATELVIQVLFSCSSVNDVLALSATCRRFRNISLSSQRLAILEHAAEAQYGPLEDLTQLLTHNASQPAHIIRSVPFSLALVKQMAHAGRIAAKWCDLYPFKKWKHDYESRRLLTSPERYRLRRAIYRIWLYSRAFHNAQHPRESRLARPVILQRAALLHNWTTRELSEIADTASILRDVVRHDICPSNGTIARKFHTRHPHTDHSLLFNMHANPTPRWPPPTHNPFSPPTPSTTLWRAPSPPSPSPPTRPRCKFTLHPRHDMGAEGWGDAISHYYVIEDYVKLDPEQVLWLREHAPLKGMVQGCVRLLGAWFENNGGTLGQTVEWVLEERGECVGAFGDAVREARAGVAVVGGECGWGAG